MNRYRIENTTSGTILGTYEAKSEYEALDEMARDAGYVDYKAAQRLTTLDHNDLSVVEVQSQDRVFEMNGKTYATDTATVNAIRSIVPSAKASGDYSAVAAIMALGMKAGRISEVV